MIQSLNVNNNDMTLHIFHDDVGLLLSVTVPSLPLVSLNGV